MYYFVFALLYLFSLLPYFIIYAISNCIAFLLYHVVRYRRKVVFSNLTYAFPEKSAPEIQTIAKQFYKNFCDSWLETIKMISISESTLKKRISSDVKVLDQFFEAGRGVNILLGHQFNWEYCNLIVPHRVPFKVLVAYSPIENKTLNRLFLYIRQRFDAVLVPHNDMRRAMLPHRHTQYILGLVADQSPPVPSKSYWVNFLNKPTPFLKGPEKGARFANTPCVFVNISRSKRGHYNVDMKLLNENPAAGKEGELTKQYAVMLEQSIRQDPALYLWSHKRWKHPWHEHYMKEWVDPVIAAPTQNG